MKTHTERLAIVVEKIQILQNLPASFINATKVHCELVDVVDFYGEEKPQPLVTRTRTHLENL
jgi:hypothetical protein